MCGYVSAPDMHYILFDAAFFLSQNEEKIRLIHHRKKDSWI